MTRENIKSVEKQVFKPNRTNFLKNAIEKDNKPLNEEFTKEDENHL